MKERRLSVLKVLWVFGFFVAAVRPEAGLAYPAGPLTGSQIEPSNATSALSPADCGVDTDRDGFSDCVERKYSSFGFDPTKITLDSDRDGLPDSLEVELGTDPEWIDMDGDRYSDFDEHLNGFYGFNPRVFTLDSDNDGLTDDLERKIGSDPAQGDSDHDRVSDFQEYRADTDPLAADEPFEDQGGSALFALEENVPGKEGFSPAQVSMLYGADFLLEPFEAGIILPSAALVQSSASFDDSLYHTNEELNALLLAWSEQYDGDPKPDIAALHILGQTHEGRLIYALKISDNPAVNEPNEREILFNGAHHAIELVGVEITIALIDELLSRYEAQDSRIQALVNSSEIWVVPLMNPDGHLKVEQGLDWRKNTKNYGQDDLHLGVDLNRNYSFRWRECGITDYEKTRMCQESIKPEAPTYTGPYGFSEEETRAIRDLVNNTSLVDGFAISLSWHSYGGEILYPWHYTTDAPYLDELDGERFANAARIIQDAISRARSARGEPAEGYDISHPFRYLTGGSSDDWLYGEKGILTFTIEAFGEEEGNTAGSRIFNPSTRENLDQVISNNLAAALAFATNTKLLRTYLPMLEQR